MAWSTKKDRKMTWGGRGFRIWYYSEPSLERRSRGKSAESMREAIKYLSIFRHQVGLLGPGGKSTVLSKCI